jgi:hypothetical protein
MAEWLKCKPGQMYPSADCLLCKVLRSACRSNVYLHANTLMYGSTNSGIVPLMHA